MRGRLQIGHFLFQADNSSIAGRFLLSDIASVASVQGSFGSPIFVSSPRDSFQMLRVLRRSRAGLTNFTPAEFALDSGFDSIWPLRLLSRHSSTFLTKRSRLRTAAFRAQQLLQYPDSFVHMSFLQQEGRKETQNRVLCAIEEHALGKGLLDDRTSRNVQKQSCSYPPFGMPNILL